MDICLIEKDLKTSFKKNTKGYLSSDYFFFEVDALNRKIDPLKKEKLKARQNTTSAPNSYAFDAPIITFYDNKRHKLIITQGAHRFKVSQEQGREIAFTITDTYNPPVSLQIDTGQDWSTLDCVASYSKNGNLNYEVLLNLKHQFPEYALGTLTIFLNGVLTSDKELRNQNFSITNFTTPSSSLNIAIERIKRFEEFLTASHRTDRSKEVIKLLIDAYDNYATFNWSKFIKSTTRNYPITMTDGFKSISTKAKAKLFIETLYNYKSRENFMFLT